MTDRQMIIDEQKKTIHRLQQECERLRFPMPDTNYAILTKEEFEQLNQLKAEVKSKTEYMQEQREIIDQYSKEIEMYKKCQGKRASRREEELKTENKHLSEKEEEARHYLEEAEKFKTCLTEIQEIAEENIRIADLEGLNGVYRRGLAKQILQKVSEVVYD